MGNSIFAADVEPEAETYAYQVQWNGINKHPLKKEIKEASRVERLQSVAPPSLSRLRVRMQEDIVNLQHLLQASGYYEATFKGNLDSQTTPITIRLTGNSGPLYTIGQQTFSYPEAHPPVSAWTPYLQSSDSATTRIIETSERRMLLHFKNNGHPFPLLSSKSYTLDPDRKKMDLAYEIDPGPEMFFGEVEVDGITSIDAKSIERQITWAYADRFDQRLINDLEKDLILTGLYSRIIITPVISTENPQHIDILISVTERYQRTFRFGVNYRSDVGFGTKLSWEHRNIFGNGERFRTDLEVAELETIATASLRKPGFQINNQTLVLGLSLSDERPDAYTSTSIESYVGLERAYQRTFATSLGLAYKYSSVQQAGSDDNYGLLSLPFETLWDTTRSDLDPAKGHRLISEIDPYTDLLNGDLDFYRLQLIGTKYITLKQRPVMILGLRATAGSLIGADSSDIPADERYYSGGGGSVRGYSYQSIGPKVDGQPVGGTSLLETSIELRMRFTETWGMATFLDGGMVTHEQSPFGNQPLQWGAGLGLRIFSGIGPLRIDLAYPINPDEDQESRLQFYISLGQAF